MTRAQSDSGGKRGRPSGALVYLDYNATTPLDPRVLDAMMPHLTSEFGNPASESHVFGRRAKAAVQNARAQVALFLGATADEICFTSGATESCNLAVKGAAEMYRDRGNHIITALNEHEAVREPCRRLERHGFEVTWLAPDSCGAVHPEQVAQAITDKTILLSIMAANNVVGTINDTAEIGAIAKERRVLFHCDATQAVGKIPVDVERMGVDLLSLSGHKLYGPKGVGALYVRACKPRVRLTRQNDGGGQERGLRSGTLNVPGIVGLGAACGLCAYVMPEEERRLRQLRDMLHVGLCGILPKATLNGHPIRRLPNTLNLTLPGLRSDALMMRLGDIALSSTAACSSGSDDPHYVLKAMGLDKETAEGSLRFSVGRFTLPEDIEFAVDRIANAVTHVAPG